MPRRTPPPMPSCASEDPLDAPRIASPLRGVSYALRRSAPREEIALDANVAADVRDVFWFDGSALIAVASGRRWRAGMATDRRRHPPDSDRRRPWPVGRTGRRRSDRPVGWVSFGLIKIDVRVHGRGRGQQHYKYRRSQDHRCLPGLHKKLQQRRRLRRARGSRLPATRLKKRSLPYPPQLDTSQRASIGLGTRGACLTAQGQSHRLCLSGQQSVGESNRRRLKPNSSSNSPWHSETAAESS